MSRLHFKTKLFSTGRKIANKKNFLPIRSNPTWVRKFQNKCKKILKNKKISSRIHFKTKRVRTCCKIENKKNFLPIRSNPTLIRKFKNKCKNIEKHHLGFISRRNGSRQAKKQRRKKISFLSAQTRPELENSKINAKKF